MRSGSWEKKREGWERVKKVDADEFIFFAKNESHQTLT